MNLLSKFVSITLFIMVFVNLTNSVFISRKKASKTIRSIARYGRTKNFKIEYNNPYPEQTFLQKIKKSTEEILDTDKIIEECFFKKCDFEEVLELSESFEVASYRWIDYTDRCRLDKYKCDPLNTIVCLNFWQGRKCVCKTGFTGGNCGKCIVKIKPGESCLKAFRREIKLAEDKNDIERLNYLKKKVGAIHN